MASELNKNPLLIFPARLAEFHPLPSSSASVTKLVQGLTPGSTGSSSALGGLENSTHLHCACRLRVQKCPEETANDQNASAQE